jgi:hypothetical protein
MRSGDPVEALLARLGAADVEVLGLLEAWSAPAHAEQWVRDVRLHRGFAGALLEAGHPTQAFELAREGLRDHAGDRWLIYLSAQALVRGRNPEKAWEYLQPMLADGGADDLLAAKAHGLAARIHKDLCLQAGTPAARKRHARAAAAAYQAALAQRAWSFAAINAATMLRVAGEREPAAALARTAIELVGRERVAPVDGALYWLPSTLGEAYLLLGDAAAAAAAYREAVQLAGRRWGDVAAMRANLVLLERVMAVPDEVFAALDIGAVVVFSGHMLDHPGRARKPPRFPDRPELIDRVGAAVRAELDGVRALVGYASVACGSDILFAEAMLARGGELHLVLPFDRDDFFRTSVDFGLPAMAPWRARAEAVLAGAAAVHHATREPYLGADALFGFADTVAQGMAINRAAQLGVEPVALVVRDPAAPALTAGTAAFARSWARQQRPLREIDLAALRAPPAGTPARRPRPRSKPRPATRPRGARDIKAMLFADVKNFSRLPEARAPSFFLTFLAEVDRTIKKSRRRPVFQNTWGDGLYLVFDGVVDCADLSLRLLDRLAAVDWPKVGLPADTAVRIGLHCGPVYRGRDPIIGRDSFFGSHVTRAARIEPVTPPGCAFASEQFAAALAAVAGHDFACDYVGVQPLAKDAGTTALYRLRARPAR